MEKSKQSTWRWKYILTFALAVYLAIYIGFTRFTTGAMVDWDGKVREYTLIWHAGSGWVNGLLNGIFWPIDQISVACSSPTKVWYEHALAKKFGKSVLYIVFKPEGDYCWPSYAVLVVLLTAMSLAKVLMKVATCARVSNECRNCGYSLTGNISGRCPECGTKMRVAKLG